MATRTKRSGGGLPEKKISPCSIPLHTSVTAEQVTARRRIVFLLAMGALRAAQQVSLASDPAAEDHG